MKKPDFKKITFENAVKFLLLLVLAYQLIINIKVNLGDYASHLSFDSSWPLLKAKIMWDYKSIINKGLWVEQTGSYLDSALTIASIFYGITKNLIISYGLANNIIMLLILLTFDSILRKEKAGLIARLAGMNLILCPYLIAGEEELGYYSVVITGAGWYAVRILLALLIIRTTQELKEKKRTWLLYVTVFLSFLSGVSVGIFMIIVMFSGCLVYLFRQACILDDYKKLVGREARFYYKCIVFTFVGKIVGEKIVGAIPSDEKTWTCVDMLWTNFLSVIQGFCKLLGVLPVNDANRVNILDKNGIQFVCPLIIAMLLLFALFAAFRKLWGGDGEDPGSVKTFATVVFFTNVAVFTLFNSRYVRYLFEERYLVIAYIAAILVFSKWIDQLDVKKFLPVL